MALVAFRRLLALWVRRCRDLGRLNVEASCQFLFGVLSLDFLAPLASGGVCASKYLRCLENVVMVVFDRDDGYSLYVGLWPGKQS